MKNIFVLLFIIILCSCNNKPIKEIIYVPVTDSTNVDSFIYYREMYRRSNDSIDSLNIDLFIAKYKLERIRYYNDIAAKGNNIKYIRGWINRVLNE